MGSNPGRRQREWHVTLAHTNLAAAKLYIVVHAAVKMRQHLVLFYPSG